jgi:hypothetical protein
MVEPMMVEAEDACAARIKMFVMFLAGRGALLLSVARQLSDGSGPRNHP